jgi:hypothetical protein
MIQLIQDPIRELDQLDQLDHGSPFPGGRVWNFASMINRLVHPAQECQAGVICDEFVYN